MQTQDAVAGRALALWYIALRAQAENHMLLDRPDKLALGTIMMAWVEDHGIEKYFSKSELSLHEKNLGDWTHDEISERFWRVQSLQALLWALGFFQTMPSYFKMELLRETYSRIEGGDPTPFFQNAKLRSASEIETQRHFAQFLNWRYRTELFRLQGAPPPSGETYDGIVARALDEIQKLGIQVEHDTVDILIDDVRFRDLPPQAKSELISICVERQLALEWICWDQADWDKSPTNPPENPGPFNAQHPISPFR